MKIRVTSYLDKYLVNKLDHFENKSKIVQEALHMFFLNREYFIFRKEKVENEIKQLELKLEDKRLELSFYENHIKEIDRKKKERPKDYFKSIYVLKKLPDVTMSDIYFQAEKLHVDVGQFKEWLFSDGYFDEIFGKNKKQE